MVVAQLVERWSLPIPEARGSNPVISKIILNISLLSSVGIEKTKTKKNEAWNSSFKKQYLNWFRKLARLRSLAKLIAKLHSLFNYTFYHI